MKISLSLCTAVVVSSLLSLTAMAADNTPTANKQKAESTKTQQKNPPIKQAGPTSKRETTGTRGG